MRKEAKTEMY